jgi:hypothetical protein
MSEWSSIRDRYLQDGVSTRLGGLAALAELQRLLSAWYRSWSDVWADESRRAAVGETASEWSARVLALSGLGGRGT